MERVDEEDEEHDEEDTNQGDATNKRKLSIKDGPVLIKSPNSSQAQLQPIMIVEPTARQTPLKEGISPSPSGSSLPKGVVKRKTSELNNSNVQSANSNNSRANPSLEQKLE